MDEIGVSEAKDRFTELLAAVEAGNRWVITKNGKPVALLSPVQDNDPERTRAAIDRLRANRRGRLLGGDLHVWREEGRK